MNKVFKVFAYAVGAIVLFAGLGVGYLYLRYPDAGPVPVANVEPTPERIARGEYLANHVAVCMDCHSTRDWSKFSGPPVAGTIGKGGDRFDESMGLPGTIYAVNITPDALGAFSDGVVKHAIVSGIGTDGRALFPLMPYPAYRTMSDEDVASIIAYLRTLKPIPSTIPARHLNFPVNLMVRTIPAPYTPSATPTKNNAFEYGKYLTTIAGCIDCHTPQDKGELIKGMEFAGGWEIPLPRGTARSANISPDEETGIGLWTKEIFVAKFKEFENPDSAKLDLAIMQRETIMPWTMYAGMSDDDLGAIYDYLRTVTPHRNRVETWIKR